MTVTADWSLSQEILDQLLYMEPRPPQAAEDARDKAMRLANSWGQMRNMAAWKDLAQYLTNEYRRHMQDLRDDEGAGAVHREVLTFIEGVMNIPTLAARFLAQYEQQGTDEAPQVIEVNHG
jgi:hypothetical protein